MAKGKKRGASKASAKSSKEGTKKSAKGTARTVAKKPGAARAKPSPRPNPVLVLQAARKAGYFVPTGAVPVFFPPTVFRFLDAERKALIKETAQGLVLEDQVANALCTALGGENPAELRHLLDLAYNEWDLACKHPFFGP